MKKLLLISILLLMIFAVKTNAKNTITYTHYTIMPDSVRKKIKHPAQAMNDTQLNNILNAMRQKKNDAEKIDVLKDGIKDKGIKVEQLITLLNQFLTDDSKLTAAEYAWPYTVDYKTFLSIQDYFASEKYKMELEDFVSKNKK